MNTLPEPSLVCYRLEPNPPLMVPGQSGRAWMDETPSRFAYRCTPLSIANASGWEILSPCSFQATWDGLIGLDAITIQSEGDNHPFVVSHFGSGVLTFHTGYLFRTPPGWAVWARGAPNTVKDGIVPLDGLVETDWLPLPFTMNWRFTRPGEIRFEKDEPFCFVTLFPHGLIDAVEPKVLELFNEPGLQENYAEWSMSRLVFNADLKAGTPEAVAEGWQRRYLHGKAPDGTTSPFHCHKRRLKKPIT
jgi:hypothetical protein